MDGFPDQLVIVIYMYILMIKYNIYGKSLEIGVVSMATADIIDARKRKTLSPLVEIQFLKPRCSIQEYVAWSRASETKDQRWRAFSSCFVSVWFQSVWLRLAKYNVFNKLYESDAFALLSRDGGLLIRKWDENKKMLPLILVDLLSMNLTFPDILFLRRHWLL